MNCHGGPDHKHHKWPSTCLQSYLEPPGCQGSCDNCPELLCPPALQSIVTLLNQSPASAGTMALGLQNCELNNYIYIIRLPLLGHVAIITETEQDITTHTGTKFTAAWSKPRREISLLALSPLFPSSSARGPRQLTSLLSSSLSPKSSKNSRRKRFHRIPVTFSSNKITSRKKSAW